MGLKRIEFGKKVELFLKLSCTEIQASNKRDYQTARVASDQAIAR